MNIHFLCLNLRLMSDYWHTWYIFWGQVYFWHHGHNGKNKFALKGKIKHFESIYFFFLMENWVIEDPPSQLIYLIMEFSIKEGVHQFYKFVSQCNVRSHALILPLYVNLLKSARLCSRRTSSREPEQLPCCVEADLRKDTYNGSISVSDLTF